jgi:hypothetical protein
VSSCPPPDTLAARRCVEVFAGWTPRYRRFEFYVLSRNYIPAGLRAFVNLTRGIGRCLGRPRCVACDGSPLQHGNLQKCAISLQQVQTGTPVRRTHRWRSDRGDELPGLRWGVQLLASMNSPRRMTRHRCSRIVLVIDDQRDREFSVAVAGAPDAPEQNAFARNL